MPSKKFLEYQSTAGRPDGPEGMPGAPAFTIGKEGVPVMPDGYVPPEPQIPEGFSGGKISLGGVDGMRITKPGLREGCVLMYIHGGGFTLGTAMESGKILKHFAAETGLEGYSVEYRLAPKYQFPTAVEDCVAFYKGLLDMGYGTIVVGGESAGAALTLSLTLALKDRGLPLPAAIWCSSPVDDTQYAHRELYRHDMFSELGDKVQNAYAPEADPKNPLLSPIYGDFAGFPPMLIQAGGNESLSAGCVRLAVKAAAADVEVVFHYGKDMSHTFAMDFGLYPEATNAMRQITSFINNVLDLDS